MAHRKGPPEKKKKKLLMERPGTRCDASGDRSRLRQELGGGVFEDHNLFREQVNAGLKKLELKLAPPT